MTQTLINNELLLHLSLLPQVGPAHIISLIQALGNKDQRLFERDQWWQWAINLDLRQLYSLSEKDCQEFVGLTPRVSKIIVEGLSYKKILEDELVILHKHPDIRVITIFDDEYPDLLRSIYLPPIVLYAQGASLEKQALRLAVVGARKANSYAAVAMKRLIPEFVLHGWQIVSGGALGVDSNAHQLALTCKGKTIVVLGSGLLELYPEANKPLFNQVIKNNGTLLSPFPLTMVPERGNFPARNRIISGLSLGTVVVQAAEKSGALITAQYAVEQGRAVFAVPGPITDPLSIGCHALIKDGAKLVGSVQDILEEFGTVTFKKSENINNNEALLQKDIFKKESHYLLGVLTTPQTIDALHELTEKSFSELKNDLFELQLEGIIKQNYAGLWELL